MTELLRKDSYVEATIHGPEKFRVNSSGEKLISICGIVKLMIGV